MAQAEVSSAVSVGAEPTLSPCPSGPPGALQVRARAVYDAVVADPAANGLAAEAVTAQARSAHDPAALVTGLRALGWVERSRMQNSAAKELLDEAVRIARKASLRAELREALITRAAVNHELGRLPAAQRDLDAAEQISSDRGAPDLALQQAVLHHSLGELRRAGAGYRKIIDDPDATTMVRAKAINNLAIIQTLLGRPEEALRSVVTGSSIPGLGPHLSAVLSSTKAWVTTQTGRLTDGLAEFARAAQLHEEAGLPLAEHYLEYVDALTDLRLLPEAYELAVQASRELERSHVDLMTGEGLLRVARLAALLGDTEDATRAASRARELFDRQHRTPWRARTDVIIGEIAYTSGSATVRTLGMVRRAATTLERVRLPSYAVEAHLTAGRIALALGRRATALTNLERAAALGRRAPVLLRLKAHLASSLASEAPDQTRLRHCRAGLDDLAAHRAAFASLELRVRASGHGAELGQLGLEVLLRHGTPAQVLAWMERTRAAALVAVEPSTDLGIDDELAALRSVDGELSEAQQGGGADVWSLLARQRNIEEQIRRRTWRSPGAADGAGQALSTSELRQQLGEMTLVEYAVQDDQVVAVVMDGRRTRLARLGSAADVRHYTDVLLFGLRRMTRSARSERAAAMARASVHHALRFLDELLLAPLGLDEDQPLVVSPTAALRRIPWSALRRAPICVVPAAAFWNRTSRPRPRTDEVLLVAGPELPGAVEEVAQLRDLYAAPTVLAPPDSTIEAVVPHLATADLAHVACHGRLRADNPAFSGLQLNDGLLTLHEMDIRGVAPYRMILAACDSAVDAVYEGNEVLGFVGALMARGTCGLVASVVVVPDAASVPLMRSLHQDVQRGHTLGQALFRARSEVDTEDDQEFVNWCAFNAYGAA